MTATVDINYRAEEARYRANFVRNGKVVDWKYLTNDEHEALDVMYHLPMEENVTKLNAETLHEYLGCEVQIERDSHFGQMLDELMKR